jgi:hypothetical protein
MMQDVFKVIDRLSPDELRLLREYIDTREQQVQLRAGTVDMDKLLSALEELRAGLSEAESAEIERAMNEEYIEPLDIDTEE